MMKEAKAEQEFINMIERYSTEQVRFIDYVDAREEFKNTWSPYVSAMVPTGETVLMKMMTLQFPRGRVYHRAPRSSTENAAQAAQADPQRSTTKLHTNAAQSRPSWPTKKYTKLPKSD